MQPRGLIRRTGKLRKIGKFERLGYFDRERDICRCTLRVLRLRCIVG
jgi:hypothetical protein